MPSTPTLIRGGRSEAQSSEDDGGPGGPEVNHENLDVYQAAIRFAALAAGVLDRFPRGHAAIADQLRRAAFSIPLIRGGRSAA